MFISELHGSPTMYFFVVAGFYKLFGVGVFGIRLLSALMGAATIPILYLLLRDMFNRQVALFGAAYLVAYHFHLHYSRIDNNMTCRARPYLTSAGVRAVTSDPSICPDRWHDSASTSGGKNAPMIVVALCLHCLELSRLHQAKSNSCLTTPTASSASRWGSIGSPTGTSS
jgi:hypothetical protein